MIIFIIWLIGALFSLYFYIKKVFIDDKNDVLVGDLLILLVCSVLSWVGFITVYSVVYDINPLKIVIFKQNRQK